jgi:membrane fusion protein (multidrug efflux system)
LKLLKIRLDRVSNDYNRYNNLYKSHTITKQQYRQALSAKLERKSSPYFATAGKATAFQKSVVVAKSKQLTNRLM